MFSKEPNSERNDILTKILEKEIKTVCLKITYALTNIAIKLKPYAFIQQIYKTSLHFNQMKQF